VKYQLVLQWSSSSESDYDRLLALGQTIEDGLGDRGIVDGHDIGSGEMNIFTHSDEPLSAFDRSKHLLAVQDALQALKARYRYFDEEAYTPIYPKGVKLFSIL
jgi:hypothetical protein